MDALASTYGSDSDSSSSEDKGPKTALKEVRESRRASATHIQASSLSPQLSQQRQLSSTDSHHLSSLPLSSASSPSFSAVATSLGYVSKRKQRAQQEETPGCSAGRVSILSDYYLLDTPVNSESEAPPERKKLKHGTTTTAIPRNHRRAFSDHTKPVLSLEWHPHHPHLLLSGSLDGKSILWDTKQEGKSVAAYNFLQGKAVRDVAWLSGETAMAAGYDHSAVYMDLNYSKELSHLKHSAFVSVVKAQPSNRDLVLTGDFDGSLQLWDFRVTSKPTRQFKGAGGKILDAIFLHQEREFAASSDIVRKNAFSQAMNVWDLDSGVTLSNQLYFEPFTCPCLRAHVSGTDFLAQSNGNYVVLFSAKKPFKLNKYKRFKGHYVSGFDVGFDINADGTVLCSASSEGKVHFYDYISTKQIKSLNISNSACLAVTWNVSQVAVSDWDGNIHIIR